MAQPKVAPRPAEVALLKHPGVPAFHCLESRSSTLAGGFLKGRLIWVGVLPSTLVLIWASLWKLVDEEGMIPR